MFMAESALALLTLALSGASAAQQPPSAVPAATAPVLQAADAMSPRYVPQRVYQSQRKRFSDFEAMLADLSRAEIVVVGEQHDDPDTHRLEVAMLQGLARRRGAVVLSLEMFERDVQGVLDDYLAGRVSEQDFLRQSRPWPGYATDYRAMVELAKAHGWPIVAANVPRKYASEVSKAGIASLMTLSDGERPLVAKDLQCPFDKYFDRFARSMNEHPMPGGEKKTVAQTRDTTERFYFAQCVKDETMAESIAGAFTRPASSRRIVVHVTGSFHSEYGQGTPARVDRRLSGARVALVLMVPVEDLDRINPSKDDRRKADYLVYTLAPPKPAPR